MKYALAYARSRRPSVTDAQSPNPQRIGNFIGEPNFGLISIDWTKPDPEIALELRKADNSVHLAEKLSLRQLQPKE